MSERTLVGWQPWLPWPLSAWRWWTEPVRAEYLAVLRIGVAAVLLGDIFLTYLPQTDVFFGPDSLGSPEVFAYLHAPGSWRWSLWHGLGNPLLSCLALSAWLVCTALLLLGFWARLTTPGPHPCGYLRWLLLVWLAATLVAVLGLWARAAADSEHASRLLWLAPLAAWVVLTLFVATEFVRTWQGRDADRALQRALVVSWAAVVLLVAFGFWKSLADLQGGPVSWPMGRWEDEPRFLSGAAVVWAAAAALLLLGLATRWSAVLVWLISTSFAHLNSYIDNAGDTVRGILLFYLMLCPCGAAWSLDDYLARRRGSRLGVVYVSPWPLRLLFVQMVFIYWMNGLHKLLGRDWIDGESYYYVMCDLAVTRFSHAQFPLPYAVTWLVTLVIVFWEVTFPLWMPFRRTRLVALWVGALFHLGTFVQMELGGFGPYMLCLYLPLLPWDRWLRDSPSPH
jgi:hypothetical protein